MFRLYQVLLLFSISCTSPGRENEKNISATSLSEPLNAAFLIVDGVYNSELMAPYDIFQHTIFHTSPGIRTFTISPKIDTVTTFEGIRILPDFDFENTPKIDILVVPSAEGSMSVDLQNQELIEFVQKAGEQASYVMSLCDGAFILAKAGLISGKVSTTFPGDIKAYRSMFPELEVVEHVSFVHDGSILTSAGGAKSYDVALYLVHHLYGNSIAENVGKGLVIDWNLENYQYIIVD